MTLTKEEKEILDSVERGEWRRIPHYGQEAARYREIARATLQNDMAHRQPVPPPTTIRRKTCNLR